MRTHEIHPLSEINMSKPHHKVEKKGKWKGKKREEGKGERGKKEENIFAKSNQNKSWKEFSVIASVMLLL